MPTDDQPKVSIAMPVYNGDRYLCQALNSQLRTFFLSLLLFCLKSVSFKSYSPILLDCYIAILAGVVNFLPHPNPPRGFGDKVRNSQMI